jgi:exopolysaccharide biosynthesis WecB/TagA/CpsF family protein
MAEERALRRGDVVEVRSAAEIRATLDEHGALDGLPFMPEMMRHCGRRFTVLRRAEKICDTINSTGSRRLRDTVLLDDLRCDGSAHGGCQAECRIFWKEAWLRLTEPALAPTSQSGDEELNKIAVKNARIDGDEPRWRCQATELYRASEHLRTFDPRPYMREYVTGNVHLLRLLRVLARAVVYESRRKVGLLDQVPLRGAQPTTPRKHALNLQPGELVEVKTPQEISSSLTSEGKNRGLVFDREMLPYCGKQFRVRRRIGRFVDERTGRMIEIKTDCVTLEGVVCSGELSSSRWLCPRAIYPYWREDWLRRIDARAPEKNRSGHGASDAWRVRTAARGRISVLGVPLDPLTMQETVEAARAMVRSRVPHQHVGINAALLVESERNPSLRRAIEQADLISADGMSAVLLARVLGMSLPERVAGVDLFQRLVAAAHVDNSSVYFLGASDEVVARVAAVFARRYPGLRIAGYRDGFWGDDQEVVRLVRSAQPDYLFLAIPSPRKELWLARYLHELEVPFAMGVGGSFDVVAGKVRRAPMWVQNAGFEWAWRLAQEPRRMWRRYLFSNTAFAISVARAYWRGRA